MARHTAPHLQKSATLLPERLRAARLKAGLTQRELGDLIGVPAGDHKANWNINKYESGAREPNIATLAALAYVLRVRADWLLGLE